jgi:arylsulfatase A-like enzyme
VRVPLMLIWPGHLPAGVRVAEPVSLTSLPATILDVVGRSGSFPGPSLAGYWSGHPPAPATVVSAVTFAGNLPAWYPVSGGTIESGMLGRYRYIWSARDPLGELYDHAADPQESRNLARDPGSAAAVAALRDSLLRIPSLRPRPRR